MKYITNFLLILISIPYVFGLLIMMSMCGLFKDKNWDYDYNKPKTFILIILTLFLLSCNSNYKQENFLNKKCVIIGIHENKHSYLKLMDIENKNHIFHKRNKYVKFEVEIGDTVNIDYYKSYKKGVNGEFKLTHIETFTKDTSFIHDHYTDHNYRSIGEY